MIINTETILAGLRVLNTDAYGANNIPEQILAERANNIAHALEGELDEMMSKPVAQIMIERERLIYWLVRVLDEQYKEPMFDQANGGAEQCLKELGHPIDGWRARRLIESGEPRT